MQTFNQIDPRHFAISAPTPETRFFADKASQQNILHTLQQAVARLKQQETEAQNRQEARREKAVQALKQQQEVALAMRTVQEAEAHREHQAKCQKIEAELEKARQFAESWHERNKLVLSQQCLARRQIADKTLNAIEAEAQARLKQIEELLANRYESRLEAAQAKLDQQVAEARLKLEDAESEINEDYQERCAEAMSRLERARQEMWPEITLVEQVFDRVEQTLTELEARHLIEEGPQISPVYDSPLANFDFKQALAECRERVISSAGRVEESVADLKRRFRLWKKRANSEAFGGPLKDSRESA